jgi:hypothetical protein
MTLAKLNDAVVSTLELPSRQAGASKIVPVTSSPKLRSVENALDAGTSIAKASAAVQLSDVIFIE